MTTHESEIFAPVYKNLREKALLPSQEVLTGDYETYPTLEVIQFLRQNPGERVGLVFGALHNFKDNFEGARFTPQIISICWEVEDLNNCLND